MVKHEIHYINKTEYKVLGHTLFNYKPSDSVKSSNYIHKRTGKNLKIAILDSSQPS